MKQYLMIIVVAVLFGTMAASCGKKTDDQVKIADSVGGGGAGPTPTYSVTIATATMSGANPTPGLYITAGNTNTRSASICVTDTSGTTTYYWHAYYGATNDGTLTSGIWSQGNAVTWCPGSYPGLPQYWFPQYSTTPGGPGVNFSRIVLGSTTTGSSDTAYAVVDGNPNANIRIVVDAGGGEPGK